MKKILLFLSSILILAACSEETTTISGGENTGYQPTETKLTATGLQSSYNVIIESNDSTRTQNISFMLHNQTAYDYNNIKLTPVLKENGVELTTADGYTGTSTYPETNMTFNSGSTVSIKIKYTGDVKLNLDLSLKITSDNRPEEEIYIGSVNFYTYMQALYFDGTILTPVTNNYTINSTANKAEKIILANYSTISANALIKSTNGGILNYPTENYVFKVNNIDITIVPCQKSQYATDVNNIIVLNSQGACYVELTSAATDSWQYGFISNPSANQDNPVITTPTGYKPTDPININIQ